MAEKYPREVQGQGYPLAPATVVPRSDEEYGTTAEQVQRKKKRMKCFAYIAIFAVFQVAVILVFSLTVMRIKTPKVRLDNVVVTASPSGGDVKLSARVLVKNTNFGHYKFDSTLATIRLGNDVVGQFAIAEARARARTTKKIAFVTDLSVPANSDSLDLVVAAEVSGKVELMKVIKKRKRAQMSCTMTVVLSTNTVQNLRCQ